MDGKNIAVQDGVPGEPYDWIGWPPAVSDDGSKIAYVARLGQQQFCVTGSTRSAPHRYVGPPSMTPDGRFVAYAADGRCVVNGQAGPEFRWISDPILSRGGRVAYRAETEGLRYRVVVDGNLGPTFDRVTQPTFSEDGRVVAYGGVLKGQWFLMVGNRQEPINGPVTAVFLNSEGTRHAVVTEISGGYSVNGGPAYTWVSSILFSRDGGVVYLAAQGRKKFLIAAGRSIELGEWVVWDPVLDESGTRISFGAKIGREIWRKVIPLPL